MAAERQPPRVQCSVPLTATAAALPSSWARQETALGRRQRRAVVSQKAEDHRCDPGTASDLRDPHAPGAAGRLWTQERACARSSASRGSRLQARTRLAGPGTPGRQPVTRRFNRPDAAQPRPFRRPDAQGRWSRPRPRACGTGERGLMTRCNPQTASEREHFRCALNARRISVSHTDRLKRVWRRLRGAAGKRGGAWKHRPLREGRGGWEVDLSSVACEPSSRAGVPRGPGRDAAPRAVDQRSNVADSWPSTP
jgi:hypothetical protein